MKLRTIIFIILLALGILPILTLVGVNLRSHLNQHETMEKKRTAAGAASSFVALNARVKCIRKSLLQAAATPMTAGFSLLSLNPGERQRLADLLLSQMASEKLILEVRLFDTSGKQLIHLLRHNGALTVVPEAPSANAHQSQAPLFQKGLTLKKSEIDTILGLAPADSTASRLSLTTPIPGADGAVSGLVIMDIAPDLFLETHENSYWTTPAGLIVHLPSTFPELDPRHPIASGANLLTLFPALAPRMTENHPFVWDNESGPSLIWLPLIFNNHLPPTLWLGSPVDRRAAKEWQLSLIYNIVGIVISIAIIISLIANAIAQKIDRIKDTILTGLDSILNKGQENVQFSWTGPREVVNLAEELTNLASRYALTRAKQQKAEAEAMLQQQQLVQADKMISLGVLVAGVAHEINNPNSIAMLNASLLHKAWKNARSVLDEYFRENGDFLVAGLPYSEMRTQIPRLFAELEESARRIKNIVHDLKDYARQDTSRHMEPLAIKEVIEAAVRLNQNKIKNATANFRLELAPHLPPILGNRQRLEQVLINLIQNSCEALTSHEQAITITANTDPGTNEIVVSVHDQGGGIPSEVIQRITDPFFTTKRPSGGTGLGLSVSAGIIEEHRGRLTFTSNPYSGTTAIIAFPAAGEQHGYAASSDQANSAD